MCNSNFQKELFSWFEIGPAHHYVFAGSLSDLNVQPELRIPASDSLESLNRVIYHQQFLNAPREFTIWKNPEVSYFMKIFRKPEISLPHLSFISTDFHILIFKKEEANAHIQIRPLCICWFGVTRSVTRNWWLLIFVCPASSICAVCSDVQKNICWRNKQVTNERKEGDLNHHSTEIVTRLNWLLP